MPQILIRSLLVLAIPMLLAGCPGNGGGTPQITLAGDVSCPVPPPVLDQLSATLGGGGTTITASARIRCNSIPVQGVILEGEVRHPVRTLSYTFPPTNGQGVTTLTVTLPAQISVSAGSTFDVRVKDGSGDPVSPPDPTGITIQ